VSCACPAEKFALWEKALLEAAEDHETILVVEDEVLLRIILADELRAQGYAVIEATNASEAISVLQSSMRIDLVLTDIRMPGDLDGLGLARMMRSEYPLVKVVMASGRKPDTEENDIGDGFFLKP
jgi:CheY-like chemotaxis protein